MLEYPRIDTCDNCWEDFTVETMEQHQVSLLFCKPCHEDQLGRRRFPLAEKE